MEKQKQTNWLPKKPKKIITFRLPYIRATSVKHNCGINMVRKNTKEKLEVHKLKIQQKNLNQFQVKQYHINDAQFLLINMFRMSLIFLFPVYQNKFSKKCLTVVFNNNFTK